MNAKPYHGLPPTDATGSRPVLRIVHPTDFSAASDVACGHALKLALVTDAELEERGRPFGSSEIDWFRAEQELQARPETPEPVGNRQAIAASPRSRTT